ncbi:MAG: putative maturation protein [Leviviridae sp.]|nr:MAG: putative maturation protein [Leviviridae sp.]
MSYAALDGNTRNSVSPNWADYEMWRPSWIGSVPDKSHLLPSSSASVSFSEIASRTNPSRPTVDLPTAIAELKDLPGLIRQAGRYARSPKRLLRPSEAGSAYLGYQFGIAPLVSDLHKLLNFADHFERRAREIQQIHEGGGASKRIQLFTNCSTVSETINADVSGYGPTLRYRTNTTTMQRCWASIKWVPDKLSSRPRSQSEYIAMARKAVLGLTLDSSTAWELLPWSWLIDYFSDVGHILMSRRNLVAAVPQNACYMLQTETVRHTERLPDIYTRLGGGGGRSVSTTKIRRVPAALSFSGAQAILSARQVSILSALAVSKARRAGI